MSGILAGPFALGTFSLDDGPRFPGLLAEEQVLDLRAETGLWQARETPSIRALLERWDTSLAMLTRMARERTTGCFPLARLRVHPPVEPRQIFQAGANYRAHVIELTVAHRPSDDPRSEEQALADAAAETDRRAAEGAPYLFTGLPSALTGAYDDVVLPAWTAKPDWELELCAVIGRPAFRVTPQDALEHVAGYTIANDLTARDAIFRTDIDAVGSDWMRGKNAPGFTPLGPFLVPAGFVGDPAGLQLTLRLNGKIMQNAGTDGMLFDTARLISYASRTTRLLPGDLLLTGSPPGNGVSWGRLLAPGDEIEAEITGLGRQHTRFLSDAEGTTSP
ncbi:fumarylacetoacetate hydrolase family protein [Streptomyces yokosukanensis]|uniref:fumarylacetoacetate hydrolase family protein n=1 Tax=Streptomyces yokosukanensis TaxID=67386 RepID=UPI00342226EE